MKYSTRFTYHKSPDGPTNRLLYGSLAVLTILCLAAYGYERFLFEISPHKQIASNVLIAPPKASKNMKQFGMSLGDTLVSLDTSALNNELNTISRLGVKWIRIDMSWADVQPLNSSQYDWTQLDRVVSAAKAHNLKILGVIAYTPPWASPKSCNGNPKCAPANPIQFAAFAAKIASRYTTQGADTWEIWNEPNLEAFWQPAPSPLAYTHLLQASYAAIKQAEPQSEIISGGLGDLDNNSSSFTQQAFLKGMYADGAKPYFNALGFHPYSFPALPDYVALWSGWSMMNDIPDSIRSIMAANGDSKKQIWITEYGAATNGPGALASEANFNFSKSPDHVSEDLQAEMLTESAQKYLSYPWLGGYFWYSYQDLGTNSSSNENFFGLLRYNGSPKPAYFAYRKVIASNE